MRSNIRGWVVAALALGFGTAASAQHVSATSAWFRSLPTGLPAGGYFTLLNSGATPVELVGAQSPACGMLMLHRSTETGGISRMNDVNSVAIPPGGTLEFAPGGYHLMCMNPAAAMSPGKHVGVTLIFADHRKMEVDFTVKSAAGD
ncbi:MAG TPA: copper chaperone PCu(A)C [Rhizomicrobium sp.]|jgi:copper(I)-binding protein|nr:copper chaperone PCu(A)C [Rhizomicrobium sp.]